MSNLQNRMCNPAGVSLMYCNSRGSTLPISLTGTKGAVSAVMLFTLSWVTVITPLISWYTGNERSRIILPRRSTCGMSAAGDILRFFGRSHLTSSQKHNLAESGLHLTCDVLLEESYCRRGAGCGMRPTLNCGLNDIPCPIWSTVDFDALAPLLHDGRERMDLRKQLGLH